MANTSSALKRIRSNERKRTRNRIVRSRVRTAVTTARESVPEGQGEADVLKAIRELDKAASKGVIHKNNAARRKSRLMKLLKSTKKPAAAKK